MRIKNIIKSILIILYISAGIFAFKNITDTNTIVNQERQENYRIAVGKVWDYCQTFVGTTQQDCFSYYHITFPYQFDKQKFIDYAMTKYGHGIFTNIQEEYNTYQTSVEYINSWDMVVYIAVYGFVLAGIVALFWPAVLKTALIEDEKKDI